MISVQQMFPAGWRDRFVERGRVGIGCDLGTTTKAKSNPTAIAVLQEVGQDYLARLLLRFKTSDPAVTLAALEECLVLPSNLRAARLCLDATSERFFAADVRKALVGKVVVVAVIASETTTYLSQKMTYKQYLGNLLVNTITDGHLGLANEPWIEKDFRQVVHSKGTFEAEVDEAGNHADGFDAVKLALHALVRKGGPAHAEAARVGSFDAEAPAAGPNAKRRLAMRPQDRPWPTRKEEERLAC